MKSCLPFWGGNQIICAKKGFYQLPLFPFFYRGIDSSTQFPVGLQMPVIRIPIKDGMTNLT